MVVQITVALQTTTRCHLSSVWCSALCHSAKEIPRRCLTTVRLPLPRLKKHKLLLNSFLGGTITVITTWRRWKTLLKKLPKVSTFVLSLSRCKRKCMTSVTQAKRSPCSYRAWALVKTTASRWLELSLANLWEVTCLREETRRSRMGRKRKTKIMRCSIELVL